MTNPIWNSCIRIMSGGAKGHNKARRSQNSRNLGMGKRSFLVKGDKNSHTPEKIENVPYLEFEMIIS